MAQKDLAVSLELEIPFKIMEESIRIKIWFPSLPVHGASLPDPHPQPSGLTTSALSVVEVSISCTSMHVYSHTFICVHSTLSIP